MRKIFDVPIVLLLIFFIFPCCNVYADEFDYQDYGSYSDYYDRYCDSFRSDDILMIMADDYDSISDGLSTGSFESRQNVLIWNSLSGSAEYHFEVRESGIYSIKVSYCALKSNSDNSEINLSIDGKIPYNSADRIILNKSWENSSQPTYDIYGNQNPSALTQKIMWKTSYLNDSSGIFSDPLIFYLEKGVHQLNISSEKAYFALEYISFENSPDNDEYSVYSDKLKKYPDYAENAVIRIEAETPAYTSDYSLRSTYDDNDCMCSPAYAEKTVFNTFGNELWKTPFQSAAWNFEIEKSGFYRLGIKYKQDEMRGISTNRRIYIDGKVPFTEFEDVLFPYSSDWDILSPLSFGGDDIYIYLEKGSHSIELEAVSGDTGKAVRSVDDIINELNDCYRKIIMITGTNPDKYTDYYVHEKIPQLTDKFSEISQELKTVKSDIEMISGVKGSEASQLERIYVILDKCVENPLEIPDYVPQIKDGISSVSAWSRTFIEQPLEVDYFEFISADKDFSEIKAGFFKSFVFMVKSFFSSFFRDYSILSDNSSDNSLEVWVCAGRDQTQIVKELADEYFTSEYGIDVNINLVQGTVLEACMSGDAPDTAVFLNGDFPVNLAVRNLTVCLSDFNDYEEISEHFSRNADTQYTYNGGVYALPLSQSWAMMFYRKDILSELGYNSPPETWQDLTDMLCVLQRNYMSAGLVLPSYDVSASTESGHTYAALLMQNGLSYYNDDFTMSALDNQKSLQLFKYWTDLYTKYGLEQSYDSFSRFRTGEYPIVIQDYTFANQLSCAAPEIDGLWDFTCIPASVSEDGSLSHAVNSSGSGGVIFRDSQRIDEAWLFLKWFSSDEIQTMYSQRIEGISGRMGRFTPASTYALKNISWSESELDSLMKQRDELCEIPVIPASYAVTRNIMNAFRDTVNNGENPYNSLLVYNNDINDEIKRKNRGLEN